MGKSIQKTLLLAFLGLNLAVLGAAQGTQFITGDCSSDAECASGCCGFNSGKCAGPAVAQERDGGCGFGDTQSNDDAVQAMGGGQGGAAGGNNNAAAGDAAGGNNNNNAAGGAADGATGGQGGAGADGSQFITGPCESDAECASGCCGFNSGKCAGAVVAQERDGGCGFGDAQSNDDAAQQLQRGR